MAVEEVTTLSPRPIARSTFVQSWCELAFLHWPVAPELVTGLLPEGTRPDTLDGVTYVGLVPFRMRRLGVLAGPGLPYLGTFCETNVRLYSVDEAGRRGVVFASLDATRLLPVLVARGGVRLPYRWSEMRLRRDADVITYTCRRRWPGPLGVTSRVRVRIRARIAEPNALENFLTARWGLHVSWYGRTLYLPNEHPRWPLYQAETLELDDNLIAATGLPRPTAAPVSVLYSPGVAARFGTPVVSARAGERARSGRRAWS